MIPVNRNYPGQNKIKIMKTIKVSGADIKADNGSGDNLAGTFPKRKFHSKTIYTVYYNGVVMDSSTITKIERSRNGWGA
jgi:hypothetical protein